MEIRKFTILWAFFCLLSCASALFADQTSDTLSSISSKVKFYTLSNGLRVIIYKRGEAPVFAAAETVRVGGVDEVLGYTGISHMFEHMAFKGTKSIGTKNYAAEKPLLDRLEVLMQKDAQGQKLSAPEKSEIENINSELKKLWVPGEYSREFEKRGGASLNAQTEKELTTYHVELPKNQFEFWCKVEADRLLNPVMRQFYSERDVVLEERKMRTENDPAGKLYETLLGVVFAQHPYHYPVIGYEDDIKRLTASKVADFRAKYYVPGNMVISLVGDMDPDRDIETVRRYFEPIAAGPVPPLPNYVEPPQEGERTVTVERDSSLQQVVTYRIVQYPDPDGAAIGAMAQILAHGKTSRMYEALVKKEQIVTSIDADEVPGEAYPNALMFWMEPQEKAGNQKALQAFERVLAQFIKEGPTQHELDVVKRRMASAYIEAMRSNNGLAVEFGQSEALYHNFRAAFEEYDQLTNLKTEDIKRVSGKYLIKEARTVAKIERKNAPAH